MPAALLCTVPPFATHTPPAGPAALLGYLASQGIDDFAFADLQLAFPAMPLPYNLVGADGASFVRDVADLPLALRLVRAFEEGRPLAPERDPHFDAYCLERTIHPGRLAGALAALSRSLESWSMATEAGFVGLTVWSSNYLTSLLAAAHLKRRARPPFVVAGGPQVTESSAAAALGLRSGLFDAVVLGEGEATLVELYRAFRAGRPTRGIAGTAWLEADGRGVARAERPLLKMAELPPPAFERTFLPAYRKGGVRILPLALSRGCVGECAFCSEWGFWERFRPAPPGQALERAELLVRRYGAGHLQLTDSLLNGHWGRLAGFAEGLLERGLEVGWSGFLRADIDRDTARQLARAGLKRTFVGVESLDDATLAAMNKRLDAARSFAALEALLAAGIEVQAGVIPGFPGDRPERFRATLTRLLELQARFPGGLVLNVEPFVVSPGQPMFRDLARWGLRGAGWDPETLELAPRYRDLAERVLCRVEGENQGLERLGQLRTVNALAAGPVPAGPAPTRAPVSLEPLDEGAFLLALEGPGRTRFRLVDEGERQRLEAALAAAREAGDAGLAAWEREPLHPLLSAIEAAHLALPREGEPLAPGFAPEDAEAAVALSPWAVARRLGATVWVFDAAAHGLARLPARAAGELERLRRPARRAEAGVSKALVDALAQAGLLATYTSMSR